MPEHSSSGILFFAHGDYSRPITFASAASFDSVPMTAINITEGNWLRSYHPIETPAGGVAPAWMIMWSLGEPEIIAILDKIRSGYFDVKIGFWLDNAETIYSNSEPGDLQAVDDFERCAGIKMCWGINLRSDLAQLSDRDLAAEFNSMLDYRSTRFGNAPPVGSLRGFFRYGFARWPGGRGPIRARWAYRARIGYYGPFRGALGTQYLVECEIKDLRDEIQRRIDMRKSYSTGLTSTTND